eukprot:jgi/Tetstr1/458316/TSEL_000355.t1
MPRPVPPGKRAARAPTSRLATGCRAARDALLAAVLLAVVVAVGAALALSAALRTEAGAAAWAALELRHPGAADGLAAAAGGLAAEADAWRTHAAVVGAAGWLALRESAKAAAAWGQVAWLLAGPAASRARRLAIWAVPHVASGARAAWRLQVSLPAPILLGEAGLAGLTALSLWLRAFIRRRRIVERAQARLAAARARAAAAYGRYAAAWGALAAGVAARSRTAAALLPHAAYAAAVGGLCWAAPATTGRLAAMGRDTALLSAPLAGSLWAVAEGRPDAVRARLMYWVVFGAATTAAQLAARLPLAARLGGLLPHPDEVLFFGALWVLLPFGGLQAVFSATLMPLRAYLGASHQFQSGAAAAAGAKAKGTALLGTLVTLRLLSERTARLLSENLVDGAALAAGLAFLFTPSFICRLGALYVGYAVPVNASLRALSVEGSPEGRAFWLRYWVVAVTYTLLYGEVVVKLLGWVPLLPLDHLHLLVLVWLQLPYFRGVDVLCGLAAAEVGALWHSLAGDEKASPRPSDDGGAAAPEEEDVVALAEAPQEEAETAPEEGGARERRALQDATHSRLNQAPAGTPQAKKDL